MLRDGAKLRCLYLFAYTLEGDYIKSSNCIKLKIFLCNNEVIGLNLLLPNEAPIILEYGDSRCANTPPIKFKNIKTYFTYTRCIIFHYDLSDALGNLLTIKGVSLLMTYYNAGRWNLNIDCTGDP